MRAETSFSFHPRHCWCFLFSTRSCGLTLGILVDGKQKESVVFENLTRTLGCEILFSGKLQTTVCVLKTEDIRWQYWKQSTTNPKLRKYHRILELSLHQQRLNGTGCIGCGSICQFQSTRARCGGTNGITEAKRKLWREWLTLKY
jgi:hypothetical protein